MKLTSKSEWFLLDSPIGEPDIKYTDSSYCIERILKENGEVIWFGQGTNWVKDIKGQWTYLGNNNDWIPCEEPIYETLYTLLNNGYQKLVVQLLKLKMNKMDLENNKKEFLQNSMCEPECVLSTKTKDKMKKKEQFDDAMNYLNEIGFARSSDMGVEYSLKERISHLVHNHDQLLDSVKELHKDYHQVKELLNSWKVNEGEGDRFFTLVERVKLWDKQQQDSFDFWRKSVYNDAESIKKMRSVDYDTLQSVSDLIKEYEDTNPALSFCTNLIEKIKYILILASTDAVSEDEVYAHNWLTEQGVKIVDKHCNDYTLVDRLELLKKKLKKKYKNQDGLKKIDFQDNQLNLISELLDELNIPNSDEAAELTVYGRMLLFKDKYNELLVNSVKKQPLQWYPNNFNSTCHKTGLELNKPFTCSSTLGNKCNLCGI